MGRVSIELESGKTYTQDHVTSVSEVNQFDLYDIGISSITIEGVDDFKSFDTSKLGEGVKNITLSECNTHNFSVENYDKTLTLDRCDNIGDLKIDNVSKLELDRCDTTELKLENFNGELEYNGCYGDTEKLDNYIEQYNSDIDYDKVIADTEENIGNNIDSIISEAIEDSGLQDDIDNNIDNDNQDDVSNDIANDNDELGNNDVEGDINDIEREEDYDNSDSIDGE